MFAFEKDFKGLNLTAMVDDTLVGLKYFHNWEKIAMVSDHDFLNHAIKAFSFLMPGGIKIFPLTKKGEAIKWLSEKRNKI